MLLQENLAVQQQVNSLESQMVRQREQLQASLVVSERNLVEANHRLSQMVTEEDKRQAAAFLVQQVRSMQEDR